jgi:hypothetical protein
MSKSILKGTIVHEDDEALGPALKTGLCGRGNDTPNPLKGQVVYYIANYSIYLSYKASSYNYYSMSFAQFPQ